jgi:hypothetical protein
VLELAGPIDRAPVFTVSPAHAWPVDRCEIYYSVDPDPRARFWRSADAVRTANAFSAKLPLHTLDRPLFAFANVYYRLPQPQNMAPLQGYGKPVDCVCISTLLHSATPKELRNAGTATTAKPSPVIDDFSNGLRDWYVVNADHVGLVESWTRKLTDPLYQGPDGASLRLSLVLPKTNTLTFVVIENEWRSYRGKSRTYTCTRQVVGADVEQAITLTLADFAPANPDDPPLKHWQHVDQLGVCSRYAARGPQARAATRAASQPHARPQPSPWSGPAPQLKRLEWHSPA